MSRLPLLAALLALGCASAPAHPGAPASTLRVLVYNIHAGRDAGGVDNLARVAEIVRQSGADVVLLQEVDSMTERSGRQDQPGELARLTGFHAAFGKTLDYQGGKYGIAVLSRWPIARDTLIHMVIDPPQERAGGSYEPRGALLVEITGAPSGTLRVIDTHLDPSGNDHYRRQEASDILAVVDSLRDVAHATENGATLLVGGDFNSTPESAVQAQLRAGGLRDAWAECDAGVGLSYPADTPVKRIDYLFVASESPRCAEARVLDTQASDHRPVLFTLRR